MPASELLIPVQHATPVAGRFTWPEVIKLYSPQPADALPLEQLRADLAAKGLWARPVHDPAGAAVTMRRDPAIPAEGYRLSVLPEGVSLESSTDAGAYYGIQTLRDLLRFHGRALPGVRIEDQPVLARRGVYHDCARGKVPKLDTVIALVERLAHWKINEFQLYIENTFQFSRHPEIGAGYSPFSPADILAIQESCNKHHVRFVGSLASFGHMEKILMLDRYRHLAETPGVPYRDMGGATTLCPIDPGSIALVTDLFEEFVPLFEAHDFNICGDETWELGKGRSKARADQIGVGRLYLDFILRLHEVCLRLGKRMNMWADILLQHPELMSEVPKDIVMLNWDYDPNGSRIPRTGEMVGHGFAIICCPGTHGWQSHGSRMEQANANILRFSQVAIDNRAEGLLNTDWGDFGHRNPLGVSLHGFALGAACGWNRPAVDIARFTGQFCRDVFGDDSGALAAALRLLGAENTNQLYHALVWPLAAEPEGRRQFSPVLARQRLEALQGLRLPALPAHNEFERLTLAEYALAGRMDVLAAQRVIAGDDLRGGRGVDAKAMTEMAAGLRALSTDFAELWNARNAPSRLCDAQEAMEAAAKEAQELAAKP